MGKKKSTSDAVRILQKRYVKESALRRRAVERAREALDIAEQIYTLRTQAELSQRQLAKLVGTQQSVISRLEDADYDGQSLRMLRRIAAALHCRVQVRFVPEKSGAATG